MSAALELMPRIAEGDQSDADRQQQLEFFDGPASTAARLALGDLSQPAAQARTAQAWIALERGRGIAISQRLNARTDLYALRTRDATLAQDIEQLRAEFAGLAQPAPGSLSTAMRWRAAMAKVQAYPEFRTFDAPPSLLQLAEAATGGALVAINSSEYGCGALLLTDGQASYLPLAGLTQESLVEQANRFLHALNPQPEVDTDTLHAVLEWMWTTVTGPVLNQVGYTSMPARPASQWPRIWWIPTGPLAMMPVHAAGFHRDGSRATVLDRAVSSYTPTIRLLRSARRQVVK